MSIADDITNALKAGADAGAVAADTAGKNLLGDINSFVVPHLRDIGIQVASIIAKRLSGVFNDKTAQALIESQEDSVQVLVENLVALAALEAQTIVNAIVDALSKAVNTALGFALMA